MMEENNRKGPGVFYAVMGVATLVVAIIGATFAFFSATGATNSDAIQGQTATAASVALSVEQVSPTSESLKGKAGRMVPLTTSDLATALSKDCVDSNGYVACQVYKVTVTNSEATADAVRATTTVQLTNGDIANLKWQRLESATALDDEFTAVGSHTTASILQSNTTGITGGSSDVYYFVVWLENLDTDQTNTDAGKTFGGTVVTNIVNADGSEAGRLQATFTTQQG